MSPLGSRRDGTVLTLTLDRPHRRNAMSAELVEALLAEVRAAHRRRTDLLVLRGDGPSFCAGFDLSGLADLGDADLLHRFVRVEQLLAEIHHAPFATLALAHGDVVGAGADLVCACTHRVADPAARFRFPGSAFGVVLGTGRLAARVGADVARELQVAGPVVDTARARQIGLVSEVADRDGWDAVVDEALIRETAVPATARALLGTGLRPDRRDTDLAALVRSAAVPGLADRIRAYAATQHRRRQETR